MPPSKFSSLLAESATLISRNVGFLPEQIFGNKDQFKASLSSQPQQGGLKKMCLNMSPIM
jgi:hypothetical protein